MTRSHRPEVAAAHAGPDTENPLTAHLGGSLSRSQVLRRLEDYPPLPEDVTELPRHERQHHIFAALRSFHCPGLEEARLQETIDLLLRAGYRDRNPLHARTWRLVSGDPIISTSGVAAQAPEPPLAAVVAGISGSGKTQAVLRCLSLYPAQVLRHTSFPNCAGELDQVVWLSVDVPPSGRIVDLAAALMTAWDTACLDDRFASSLARRRNRGHQVFEEWRQVASSHFLGLLHLDEVQNFFKPPPLDQRERLRRGDVVPELRIVEDECLKSVLTLTNRWRLPLLVSGTHDGVAALMRRLSNAQRLVATGFHAFEPFASADDPRFRKVFLPTLARYQCVKARLPVTDELANLVYSSTGGVQRLIVALWFAAHRISYEKQSDELTLADFDHAARTLLSPVQPAVRALTSQDPGKLSRYEDLVPRIDEAWLSLVGRGESDLERSRRH